MVFLFVCFLSRSELADEPIELNGHQDLLLTPLVSSDSPLRLAPSMQVTEKYFRRDNPSPAAISPKRLGRQQARFNLGRKWIY